MQIDSEADLQKAIRLPSETEGLDFKLAQNQYSLEKLCEYICAIAFEGGGSIVLGVTDKLPRSFVGTQAFPDLSRLRKDVFEKIGGRIATKEFAPDGKRILVISTNASPRGRPLSVDGKFYHRTGESLRVMGPDELRAALSNPATDFSSELCEGATASSLAEAAIARFRAEWQKREPTLPIERWALAELLEGAELSIDGALTNAAVLLLGSDTALRRLLPNAEVIFEYRSREADDSYSERREYKAGLLLWIDDIWDRINIRNTVRQITIGPFRHEIAAFDETTMREAILNAFAHRDYENAGSCWIRMWPARAEIQSPGGFPRGITPENIVERQHPRNRRLAEGMKRCGLVERSGQGADRMFRRSIESGKLLPDFSRSDAYSVVLGLSGEVVDPDFVRFLDALSHQRQEEFATADLRVLDMVRRGAPVPEHLIDRREALRLAGAVERVVGRNKWILSRQYREFTNEATAYVNDRGRSRSEEKEILLSIITDGGAEGVPKKVLIDRINRAPSHVGRLLDELRGAGLIALRGRGAGARWYRNNPD